MLPNFALICPNVDAHLSILSQINPINNAIHIPHEIFLCFLIRWIFMAANATIHPINAVLESVNAIAKIQSQIIEILMIVFLLIIANFFISSNFCLKKYITAGRNAIKKYP